MSLTLTELTINAALDGKQDQFDEEMRIREQHWSGSAGLGGDVNPSSGLSLHEVMLERGGEICDRLMSERGWSDVDFRYAAKRLEASGDPDLEALARHVRAMEMFASEASEKEMAQMANAQESMTRQLIAGQSEEYLREQRVPVDRPAAPDQHPRQRGWMNYPTNVRPVAEPDVDSDRAAHGATQPSMSERLRSLAAEVSRLSSLSGNPRQKNRLAARASELRRMSTLQYQREMENDVALSSDADEPNNVMSKLASDMRAEANGAQPDDSFSSYDDWSDRPTADDQLAADVRDQVMDEDLPRLPRPGRRYSGRESIQESSDLTSQIIEDQKLHWYGSHGSW